MAGGQYSFHNCQGVGCLRCDGFGGLLGRSLRPCRRLCLPILRGASCQPCICSPCSYLTVEALRSLQVQGCLQWHASRRLVWELLMPGSNQDMAFFEPGGHQPKVMLGLVLQALQITSFPGIMQLTCQHPASCPAPAMPSPRLQPPHDQSPCSLVTTNKRLGQTQRGAAMAWRGIQPASSRASS